MTQRILVLDIGLGNTGSICNMFSHIGFDVYRSSSIDDILNSKKIVLPGVGAFDFGMQKLHEADIVEPLKKMSEDTSVHILGICLGMQLLFNSSEEGHLQGLGLIPGKIKRFTPNDKKIKVPHMGWNSVSIDQPSRLLGHGQDELRYYFIHSYYAVCDDTNNAVGATFHDVNFTSVVENNNVMGVQFHPEKSHKFGMSLLKKFAEL